jgi:hypothetical protein
MEVREASGDVPKTVRASSLLFEKPSADHSRYDHSLTHQALVTSQVQFQERIELERFLRCTDAFTVQGRHHLYTSPGSSCFGFGFNLIALNKDQWGHSWGKPHKDIYFGSTMFSPHKCMSGYISLLCPLFRRHPAPWGSCEFGASLSLISPISAVNFIFSVE